MISAAWHDAMLMPA